jgi:hypothetical protein
MILTRASPANEALAPYNPERYRPAGFDRRVERAERPALENGSAPSWVTVQSSAATTRVAVRDAVDAFAAAVKVTAEDPLPARGFGWSHDAVVVAFHSHSLAAIT